MSPQRLPGRDDQRVKSERTRHSRAVKAIACKRGISDLRPCPMFNKSLDAQNFGWGARDGRMYLEAHANILDVSPLKASQLFAGLLIQVGAWCNTYSWLQTSRRRRRPRSTIQVSSTLAKSTYKQGLRSLGQSVELVIGQLGQHELSSLPDRLETSSIGESQPTLTSPYFRNAP